MSDIELSAETSVAKKRGRGRPKKLNGFKTKINDNANNGTNYTKKRGRVGQTRQPNNHNEDDDNDMADVDEGVGTADADGVTADTEVPVTGTTGRSRKRSVAAVASVASVATNKAKTATNDSVGKRGAKRSVSAAKATSTTTGGKRRGRGRPAKAQTKANVDAESTPDQSNEEEIDED